MPFRAYYLSPEGDRWRDLRGKKRLEPVMSPGRVWSSAEKGKDPRFSLPLGRG